MLRGLSDGPTAPGADLLVGLAQPDDAAVYRLGDGRVLMATLDFFTPIVDDPYQFGQVAAANSISDVYAMGGEPFLALSITCFPPSLPADVLIQILQGAQSKVIEAGAVLAGGHTVKDNEPKFGLAVLGFGREESLIYKSGARPGDRLFLTKPLGTGVLGTRLKAEGLPRTQATPFIESMVQLSRGPSRAALSAGVRGGTDVTGFSLAGHALEMAEGAGVRLLIEWRQVPHLEGAEEAAASGFIPGGTKANDLAFSPRIAGLERLDPVARALLFDPQTSGGLLLSVSLSSESCFLEALNREGGRAWPIGRVDAGSGLRIEP